MNTNANKKDWSKLVVGIIAAIGAALAFIIWIIMMDVIGEIEGMIGESIFEDAFESFAYVLGIALFLLGLSISGFIDYSTSSRGKASGVILIVFGGIAMVFTLISTFYVMNETQEMLGLARDLRSEGMRDEADLVIRTVTAERMFAWVYPIIFGLLPIMWGCGKLSRRSGVQPSMYQSQFMHQQYPGQYPQQGYPQMQQYPQYPQQHPQQTNPRTQNVPHPSIPAISTEVDEPKETRPKLTRKPKAE